MFFSYFPPTLQLVVLENSSQGIFGMSSMANGLDVKELLVEAFASGNLRDLGTWEHVKNIRDGSNKLPVMYQTLGGDFK